MRARAALVTVVLSLVSCGVGKPPASRTAIAAPPSVPVPSLPAVPPPRDDGRLPTLARPTGYRLDLTVDPSQRTFSGRATIALAVPQATRVVVMHGRSLSVHQATFTALGVAHTATATARASAHGKGEEDELVFTTAEPIAAGEATLTVDYEAGFSEGLNGLYRVENGGRAYAFTQFEPVGARLAFPCFDEPDAKVPFDVAVTVPAGLVVLSNMPAHSEAKSADGAHVTTTFERSPPLPTYLVALAVGPLDLVERKGAPVPLRLAATAGRASLGTLALDDASAHLAVLESYFGTKYPYPKLDLVAVPDFSSGAMENAGLVTFREERLLVDAATAPTALRRALAGTVAHELSHMWFGDLVTMRWWDDIWLNEGFATWMATRVLDTWKPEMRAGVEALGSTADAMRADTLATARRVRQPVRSTTEALEAFDGITYTKGAALLAMVERWLGPDVFQKGVIRYLAEHRFGNATASDLFSALAAESHVDVPAVLSTFTEQTGLPLVTIDPCAMKDGHPEVRVTESEYRPLGATPSPAPKSWQFPVCVHTSGRSGGPPEKPSCVLVTGPEARLALPGTACPAFLHPNADQSGYYRAKVEPSSLPKLAALPVGTLTARERVGLLSDAWALVESGELDVGAFLELARHFRGDPEPAVWDQITSALDELGNSVVTDASRPAFQAFVRTLLAPELAALGWEAKKKDGDAERLRRRLVIGTLGAVGRDPGVLAMADRLANQWLSQSSSVDGDRAALAVPLAARNGDAKLFDRIVGKLASDPSPAERVIAVTALGRFTDPVLVSRALGKVLDGTVRAQDQIYVYAGLFARSEARPAAFQTVAERPDEYLKRIAPFTRRRIVPFIARSCSPEETARAHALIAPRLASIEGADRGFSQAEEDGARCFVRRTHHAPLLTAYLEKGVKHAR